MIEIAHIAITTEFTASISLERACHIKSQRSHNHQIVWNPFYDKGKKNDLISRNPSTKKGRRQIAKIKGPHGPFSLRLNFSQDAARPAGRVYRLAGLAACFTR
ncbi:MAG TPA: hypothetical protein VFW00_11765, partial [Rhodocyclaceae bacterium]|nr:hypothetical protein [Rhodocyclaceae bacterium]